MLILGGYYNVKRTNSYCIKYEYQFSVGNGPMVADIYFFDVNDNMVATVQIGNMSDGNVLRIDSKEFEHRREDFPFREFLLSFVKR
ncbi:hypothetical protein [Bacillus sp. FJAT-44742]|uniref:hypothetical protein n=1 Tax=Bacillus sp. FJAT-44742 TaxID=2014005 RepID=UPI000C233675|nr:hypothetical protein [Bacillus sp. FJAT-44742]